MRLLPFQPRRFGLLHILRLQHSCKRSFLGMFQRAANRTRLSRLQFSRQQRSLLFLPLLPQRR